MTSKRERPGMPSTTRCQCKVNAGTKAERDCGKRAYFEHFFEIGDKALKFRVVASILACKACSVKIDTINAKLGAPTKIFQGNVDDPDCHKVEGTR